MTRQRLGRDATSAFGRLAQARESIVRLDRRSLRPSSWGDVALAVLVCSFVAVELVAEPHPDFSARGWAAHAVAFVPLVALPWRPRLGDAYLPFAVFCWLVAATLSNGLGADFATFIGVYTVGTRHSWRRTAAALCVAIVAGMLVGLLEGKVLEGKLPGPVEAAGYVLGLLGSFGIAAALGLWIGRRRAFVRGLVARAQDLEREREALEREHEERSRQAVAVERARIARELHDVVAHHVSVMVIQAGAAEANLPPDASAARQAIQAVGETGREAMAEMRRLLGLLRSEASFEPASDASIADAGRAPQPRLSDLSNLADRTREVGVDVSIETVGTERRLPAGVDLAAYRVVQEALTNTLRHAGPGARAGVRVVFKPESLTVEVTDDGRGKPAVGSLERPRPGVGHGLLGMRERVMLYGGRLEAGPRPGGGFRVMAEFPLEGPSDSGPEPIDAGAVPAHSEPESGGEA